MLKILWVDDKREEYIFARWRAVQNLYGTPAGFLLFFKLCQPNFFCILKSGAASGFSVGYHRGRSGGIEGLGGQEHIVQNSGVAPAGLVQHVAIQIDSALAHVIIPDLYPVGNGAVHVAEEIVAGALEILEFFIVGTVILPVADVISVGEDDGVHRSHDILNGIYPFFIVDAQLIGGFVSDA